MKTIFGPAGNAVSFAQAGFQATKDAPAWIAAKGLTAMMEEQRIPERCLCHVSVWTRRSHWVRNCRSHRTRGAKVWYSAVAACAVFYQFVHR